MHSSRACFLFLAVTPLSADTVALWLFDEQREC